MRHKQRSHRKLVVVGLWVIAILIILGSVTVQQAHAQADPEGCSLATLNGVYVFDATGYNIVNSIPVPKAIVEVLTFDGNGTLTSLATVSMGGVIHSGVPGSGIYTVNANCTGTLTFNPLAQHPGPHFDIFISPNGKQYHMIETDANTVLAGVSTRVP
jgi:hypothetical protein